MELSRADLLSITDRVIASLVTCDLNVACGRDSCSALTEHGSTSEVEALEVEGFRLASWEECGDGWCSLELSDEVGGSVAKIRQYSPSAATCCRAGTHFVPECGATPGWRPVPVAMTVEKEKPW